MQRLGRGSNILQACATISCDVDVRICRTFAKYAQVICAGLSKRGPLKVIAQSKKGLTFWYNNVRRKK